MAHSFLRALIVLVSVGLVAGCGKVEDPVTRTTEDLLNEPDQTVLETMMSGIFEKLDAELAAGRTNEAAVVLSDALADPAYKPCSRELFSTYIRFLLYVGRTEDAKAAYLGALRTAPDDARPSLDLIYGYLRESGRKEEALEWARAIAAQDVEASFRATATGWMITAQFLEGRSDESLKLLSGAMDAFEPGLVLPLATDLAQLAISRRAPETAEAVLSLMEKQVAAGVKAYETGCRDYRYRLLACRGDWAALDAGLAAYVASVPEQTARATLAYAFSAMATAGAVPEEERLAERLVKEAAFAETRVLRALGARRWMAVVSRLPERTVSDLPARLRELMALQVEPSLLARLYSDAFYTVVAAAGADRAPVLAMAEVSKALRPLLTNPEDLALLTGYDLDTAFLLDRYDEALAIVEAGVPDRDEAWHETMRTKLRAHQALAEGRLDDAAALFRAFVETLPDTDQVDPVSNIEYSREAIAGVNELRIGDFYAKAGEADKSRAAYGKAQEHFKAAIAKVADSASDTAAFLAERLAKAEAALRPAAE